MRSPRVISSERLLDSNAPRVLGWQVQRIEAPAGVGELASARLIDAISYTLEIVERVPLEVVPNEKNLEYLRTKKEKLGHVLHLMS